MAAAASSTVNVVWLEIAPSRLGRVVEFKSNDRINVYIGVCELYGLLQSRVDDFHFIYKNNIRLVLLSDGADGKKITPKEKSELVANTIHRWNQHANHKLVTSLNWTWSTPAGTVMTPLPAGISRAHCPLGYVGTDLLFVPHS